jgi:lysophospholipase L1-like esterase
MHKKCLFRIFAALLVLALAVAGAIGVATPAHAAAVKIMPLGDSITGSPGCWRALLWNRLQSAGYTNIDFVGTQPAQGCGVPYDGDSEGRGGLLATGAADPANLPVWLAANVPDIVIMHLGTNDVWSTTRSTSTILAAFTTMVGQMRAANPNVKILVAQILPMNPTGCATCAQGVIDLNAAIPAWAAGLTTSQSPIGVVDQWTGFNTATDTGDGVHPNALGDQKMSDKWYPALSALLSPSGPTNTPTRTPTPGTSTPTVTPTSLTGSYPDLVIYSVVTSPPGWTGGCALTQTSGIRVTVRNDGTVNAGAFVVDVSGTQQTVSAGLAAGATVNLWFTQTGSLVITVDITNMVVESNEGNNTRSYVTITGTAPVLCTRTPTPTGSVTAVITNTPTRTLTPGPTFTRTRTPTVGITFTPTRTLTITPTADGLPPTTCSPVTSTITAPFTYDGAGAFCWQSSNLGSYINSWNLVSLTINGVNETNLYVAAASYPAKINGYWYVSYNSTVAWGHFEAK